MTRITSPNNPRIRKLRDLDTTRGRKKSGLFFMEGPHLLVALLDANVMPREVYYSPELLSRTAQGRSLLARLLHAPAAYEDQLVEVSERVIESLGEAQTSQGVISVLPLNALDPELLRSRRGPAQRPILLILDGLADPGNLGTILRTALAANVDEVLLSPNCVDYLSPKVVRAAAGAHVALPVWVDLPWEIIAERVSRHCGEQGQVLLAEAGSPHLYYEQDLTQPLALIIGSEAHGSSQAARRLATRTISIPLANGVESLNAAMAAGIILFEGVRQQKL
ncbi:MAG TPA: RNA methyltransferase [Ktedonobacteraceae bacterium]|jgi:TrmH family RNA methyltransferase|nr:RNA methyltransferase [Ktedonobacteraceae bacterium]